MVIRKALNTCHYFKEHQSTSSDITRSMRTEVTESIFSAPNFFCRGLLSDTHVNLSLAFQEVIAPCTV
jgi:hypothetical protein